MTVGELLVELQRFPPETQVQALWDTLLWDVHCVKAFKGVVLLDVDSCGGSWGRYEYTDDASNV